MEECQVRRAEEDTLSGRRVAQLRRWSTETPAAERREDTGGGEEEEEGEKEREGACLIGVWCLIASTDMLEAAVFLCKY